MVSKGKCDGAHGFTGEGACYTNPSVGSEMDYGLVACVVLLLCWKWDSAVLFFKNTTSPKCNVFQRQNKPKRSNKNRFWQKQASPVYHPIFDSGCPYTHSATRRVHVHSCTACDKKLLLVMIKNRMSRSQRSH